MLHWSQILESSILYLFHWDFGGLGKNGTFRLLSDVILKIMRFPSGSFSCCFGWTKNMMRSSNGLDLCLGGPEASCWGRIE